MECDGPVDVSKVFMPNHIFGPIGCTPETKHRRRGSKDVAAGTTVFDFIGNGCNDGKSASARARSLSARLKKMME